MSCGPNGSRGLSSTPNLSSGTQPLTSSNTFTIAKRGFVPTQSAWSNAWRTLPRLMTSASHSGPLPAPPRIHGRLGTISCGWTSPERWITDDRWSQGITPQLLISSVPFHHFPRTIPARQLSYGLFFHQHVDHGPPATDRDPNRPTPNRQPSQSQKYTTKHKSRPLAPPTQVNS